MEIPMLLREWMGIRLAELPAADPFARKPLTGEFYSQFYTALAQGPGIDPAWIANKREIRTSYRPRFPANLERTPWPRPRILAVAAGTGNVEGVWSNASHNVTYQDCQELSLAGIRTRFPDAPCSIGDINALEAKPQFDFVSLIAFDYLFNRKSLEALLGRLRGWLVPGGTLIIYCPNILSWRQMIREAAKRLLRFQRRVPHVFYGYYRTPSEFFRIANSADFEIKNLAILWLANRPLSAIVLGSAVPSMAGLQSRHYLEIRAGGQYDDPLRRVSILKTSYLIVSKLCR